MPPPLRCSPTLTDNLILLWCKFWSIGYIKIHKLDHYWKPTCQWGSLWRDWHELGDLRDLDMVSVAGWSKQETLGTLSPYWWSNSIATIVLTESKWIRTGQRWPKASEWFTLSGGLVSPESENISVFHKHETAQLKITTMIIFWIMSLLLLSTAGIVVNHWFDVQYLFNTDYVIMDNMIQAFTFKYKIILSSWCSFSLFLY